jgi:uncharacterized protein
MLFGALGDIHGDFVSVQRIVGDHPEIPFWLCVGDIADDRGRYQDFDAPVYWIKGNNENFDVIAAGTLPANLHYIPNAHILTIQHVRVAGLGGTFAPTWYETPAADLPYPGGPGGRVRDDKRRHFVREEVDACRAMRDIDVLLTHEAPRPYFVSAPAGKGRPNDAGKTPINEVLASMQPRLHFFGHHHRFSENDRQGVRSVGLDLVSRSYLLIDAKTLEYKQLAR